MEHRDNPVIHSSWTRIVCAAVILVGTAQGAQFQFGALLQAGGAGAGSWEVGVGNTAAAPVDTQSLTTYWANNVDRLMQVEYLKTSNTVNVRVYNGATATGAFTQASFQPTGGAAVGANAIWTLPTSSFFVTATSGPVFASSMTVSNIAVSGVSGAINVIQPIQQTTLTASRPNNGGTSLMTQTQDITFQADSSGSWRLQGNILMTGLFAVVPRLGAQGSELAFGFGAGAADVPEPGTLGLLGMGGIAMAGLLRRRQSAAKRSV